TTGVTKLQYAQFLGSSLAYLANKQQDAVGLIAFDSEIRTHVPAHNRIGHMRTIFGRMEQLEAGNETRLSEMLHLAAERITRRGIIVVISDFYDEPEAIISALQHLRFKGNDVIVFHVLDKNETDFEFTEPVLLEDAETEEEIHVMPDILAEGYRNTVREHIERLREAAAQNKIDYELLTTDKPIDFALFSFLAKRARQ
ncbi:MAG TPA: VWA domain-containing protein, partial [Blastocatellia bacterium]|nr:VWA domain-containing protein [Blastocatellia bacterium]